MIIFIYLTIGIGFLLGAITIIVHEMTTESIEDRKDIGIFGMVFYFFYVLVAWPLVLIGTFLNKWGELK